MTVGSVTATSSPTEPGASSPVDSRSGGAVERPLVFWVLALVVLASANSFRLDEPPWWDAAAGMFYAADTLAATGFDLPALLAEPTYSEGGPNTHALSPITWLTGVVLGLFGASPGIEILHWLHFGIAAFAALKLFAIARRFLPRWTSILCVVAAIATPLVFVQTGYTYLEIPTLAACLAALDAWLGGRWIPASLWSGLAVAIKPSGIAVAAVLFLDAILQRQNWRRALAMLLPGLAILVGKLALEGSSGVGFDPAWIGLSIRSTAFVLRSIVPDVGLLLLLTVTILAVSYARTRSSPERTETLLVVYVLGFFGVSLGLAAFGTGTLVRYYTVLVPLLVLLAAVVVSRFSHRVAVGLLASWFVLSIANLEGSLYPDLPASASWELERSLEYRDRLALDLLLAAEAESLPEGSTVIHSFAEEAIYRRPLLGYVTAPVTGSVTAYRVRPDFEGLPDRFYLVLAYEDLGGQVVGDLLTEAVKSGGFRVDEREFTSGPFTGRLVEIERIAAGSSR